MPDPITSEPAAASLPLAAFDYDLPPGLIAQTPAERRDGARLLVLSQRDGAVAHRSITDLPDLLAPGDLLVFNDARVRPARLAASTPVEGRRRWCAAAGGALNARRPARRLRPGYASCGRGARDRAGTSRAGSVFGGGRRNRRRRRPAGAARRAAVAALHPAPRRSAADRRRALSDGLRARGRRRRRADRGSPLQSGAARRAGGAWLRAAFVTLDVGPATFLPLREDDPTSLDGEWATIPAATVEAIAGTRAAGGRVVAVGTTTTRALESAAARAGGLAAGSFWADAFIRPGFRFAVVDALITNFHLPRSTLLMLVAAFAGRERVLAAYAEAVRTGYRFYSYGDAMLIG
jgi:S-adenosylmethionine:tRNA ribosyltransferase-isomerase